MTAAYKTPFNVSSTRLRKHFCISTELLIRLITARAGQAPSSKNPAVFLVLFDFLLVQPALDLKLGEQLLQVRVVAIPCTRCQKFLRGLITRVRVIQA